MMQFDANKPGTSVNRPNTDRPSANRTGAGGTGAKRALYTPEQRARRDESKWTLVQGVLAPVQFVIFLVSLWLVIAYLQTGDGLAAAAMSVVVKTLALYAIMITGAIWEKDVYGQYLFAPAFFWEDVLSMLVLALHTAYLAALFLNIGDARTQMMIALAGYAAYVVNAGQYVWKLRVARLESTPDENAPRPQAARPEAGSAA